MFQLDTGRTAGFAAFAVDLKQALAATWNRTTFDYLVRQCAASAFTRHSLRTTEADFSTG